MNARRWTRSISVAAIGAVALAGCASGGDTSDGKITLEFPSWQAEDPTFGPWWKDLIAEYEAENPDVSIDFYQIPFDSYVDQLTTRFASNDQPEIVQLPARNASEFASRGWFAPLDDRLAGTDIPDAWTPLQSEMLWDDQTYGLLLLGYGYTLYYNEALLEKAGVAVPSSGEELVTAAQEITGDGVYGFGATTQQSPDNYTELMTFIAGNGGRLSDGSRFALDTPEAIAGMEQYRQTLAEAPAGNQSQQRNELFLNGKIAMLIDGPFFAAELENAADDVKGSLHTAAPPFEAVPGGVSNSIHVPAGLDERTEDAVWEFVELSASEEWQQRYAETASVPAPRADSVTEKALKKRPELELFQRLADEAVSIYPTDPDQRQQFSKLSQIVSDAAIRLITTDDSTEKIAADLQSQLESTFGAGS